MPAKAGIQIPAARLGSRFRGDERKLWLPLILDRIAQHADPSISISQTSPCFIHTGFGLRAWPTPDGVPVKMMSPGSSVMPCVT
jgi:hypothetical protein